MLVKFSSLTDDGCGLWKNTWATGGPLGLMEDGGNRVRLAAAVVAGPERSNELSIVVVGVLEMSNLISELFSLLLLHDPSVSLFKLNDSVGSLVFSDNICPKNNKETA